jgi:glucitol operon activator protein
LGKGSIALVVVDPASQVRCVRVMQGRSVFATFKDRPELDGLTLGELRERVTAKGFDPGAGQAIAKAIDQIEKVGGESIGAGRRALGGALKLA